MLTRKSHRRRHTQPATWCTGQITNLRKGLCDLLKRRTCVVHQALARLGQLHTARGTPHQRHAGNALQIRHVLTHGGLAHAQAGGRCGVSALLRQNREPMQAAPEFVRFILIHASIVHHFEQSVHLHALVADRCSA